MSSQIEAWKSALQGQLQRDDYYRRIPDRAKCLLYVGSTSKQAVTACLTERKEYPF